METESLEQERKTAGGEEGGRVAVSVAARVASRGKPEVVSVSRMATTRGAHVVGEEVVV